MTNFTALELIVINKIKNSEYHDGREITCAAETGTWLFVATEGKASKILRGALASLVKKGAVIVTIEADPLDNMVELTELGFNA